METADEIVKFCDEHEPEEAYCNRWSKLNSKLERFVAYIIDCLSDICSQELAEDKKQVVSSLLARVHEFEVTFMKENKEIKFDTAEDRKGFNFLSTLAKHAKLADLEIKLKDKSN